MKTLLILRHAKSSWKDQTLADHDRPLNKRGKRDGPRIGRLLRDEQLMPDLIFSSSAVRAITTAEAVADACDYEGDIRVTRWLYHAGTETFVEVLSQVPDRYERVMLVGHNPGSEELLEDLTGSWERMPTAALAQVALGIESWSELSEATRGRLVNLWWPKKLPD